MEAVLAETLRDLEGLQPSYVSVTYGAGGTTRERTHDLVVGIDRDTTMTSMAHLTCAAHTRAELVAIVERYRDSGIDNILALGGDPPREAHPGPGLAAIVERSRASGTDNTPARGGDPPRDLDLPAGELEYAVQLVELIRGVGDFSIGVAAHPEPHPRSASRESDRL